MSHIPNVYSPEFTPLLERTVGELVAERPGRSRVFQSLGIDFCCQGARTVRQACATKGISSGEILRLLENEQTAQEDSRTNPAELSPSKLCTYILNKHHAYLKKEMPRLLAMSQRVAKVHGEHTPSLIEVFNALTSLAVELEAHLDKEEEILFPAVHAMERGEVDLLVELDGPIESLLHEHDDAGAILEKLRVLTKGFEAPADACNTYRALFDGLKDLEDDMHVHIHLENAVLLPQALAMRKQFRN